MIGLTLIYLAPTAWSGVSAARLPETLNPAGLSARQRIISVDVSVRGPESPDFLEGDGALDRLAGGRIRPRPPFHRGGARLGEEKFAVTGWSKNLFPAVLILAIALILTGCSAGTEETFEGSAPGETTGPVSVVDEEVTVASNIAYPPFEFSPRNGPDGFDIDLMNEIADRAGFEVEYENVEFDGLIRGLDTDLFDAAISAMTITTARQQQADFSDPYFNADQCLLVTSYSDVESVNDLADATVGVQAGTAGQIQTQELINAGTVGQGMTFRTIEEAFAALQDGQVAGVIYDLAVAQDAVEESGGKLRIVETVPTGEQYGIAFPKDSALVEPVNEALAEIKADGTYEEIYERWISVPPEEIP